eukprot:CAMPEP_0194441466 /NCGR_PEP_ID=MMETSP0176-20130528/121816_1 /TAXON_ID=216777 /ORGANISM="Proboscia alata, Strain PI-D3" /LENGTH=44 /DNA_ID= /DNA_START= /DNA_END= /DNA_ORIENTATION=
MAFSQPKHSQCRPARRKWAALGVPQVGRLISSSSSMIELQSQTA